MNGYRQMSTIKCNKKDSPDHVQNKKCVVCWWNTETLIFYSIQTLHQLLN